MDKNNKKLLQKLTALIRYDILTSTTAAGSGHPTSSLSAIELMTTLYFGGFLRYDIKNPHYIFNDRVIFSKGHAAPLLYALYHAAGPLTHDELLTLRQFQSNLEGHPTPRFPYVDVATGSLGQGLSMGVGMALGIRLRITNERLAIKRIPRVFVLLGDSEMAEGQIWEALEVASYYKLNNLVGILDVNRLGQTGETMYGWEIETYAKRIESFGWKTIVVDNGHNIEKLAKAYEAALEPAHQDLRPMMIIARTVKGKGVSFLEDKDGWHGKVVSKNMLKKALKDLGKVDLKIRGTIQKSEKVDANEDNKRINTISKKLYVLANPIATRKAFGNALVELGYEHGNLVVFDAEVSNSTYENGFAEQFPKQYFEMYIDEENMISAAVGISKLGFVPYISTFAAFLTRGFDQIRMAQYSNANLKIIGSHVGVSIGQDGPSQMGLEDIAMMRSILNSVVLYPADGISANKLTKIMYETPGICYLRTTRGETPVIYDKYEKFEIGGSKIHYSKVKGLKSRVLIIAAGITVHEALKAQQELLKENIETVVMDCYSIKPIDEKTICELTQETKKVIVVEDHYPSGGLGEVVMQALLTNLKFKISNLEFAHLCVRKIPHSGKPEELLRYEDIDAKAIINAVRSI